MVPKLDLHLDDRRVAEDEGVDQTGPGFEAPDAAATNPPVVDGQSLIFGGLQFNYSIIRRLLNDVPKLPKLF